MRWIVPLPLLALAAAACGPAAAGPSATQPAPQFDAAAPAAPAAPAAASEPRGAAPASTASTARKRTRSGPPNPLPHDGTKPKNGRALNPKDDLGRTVFVREDDHCFVEVPRATEVVDCPPAANDAAFDHCTAQIVLDEGAKKCFCVTGANPRPMPRPTPCPAGVKGN